MKWIEVKMRELGVTSNPNYKIAFFLDNLAMITVTTAKYGTVNVSVFSVKRKIFLTYFNFRSNHWASSGASLASSTTQRTQSCSTTCGATFS